MGMLQLREPRTAGQKAMVFGGNPVIWLQDRLAEATGQCVAKPLQSKVSKISFCSQFSP